MEQPLDSPNTSLLEAAAAFSSVGLDALAIYITVLSGYLIAAFVAGSKFTKSQIWIINTIFVVSEISLIFTMYSNFNVTVSIGREISDGQLGATSAMLWIGTLIQFGGLIAALKFMRDIRKSGLPV